MIIQLNTDKNIQGDERLEGYLSALLKTELSRFTDQITRVEIHLADENGKKKGENDKRCTLEARLENMQPIAVTSHGDTVEKAFTNSLKKLETAIDTIFGKLKNY